MASFIVSLLSFFSSFLSFFFSVSPSVFLSLFLSLCFSFFHSFFPFLSFFFLLMGASRVIVENLGNQTSNHPNRNKIKNQTNPPPQKKNTKQQQPKKKKKKKTPTGSPFCSKDDVRRAGCRVLWGSLRWWCPTTRRRAETVVAINGFVCSVQRKSLAPDDRAFNRSGSHSLDGPVAQASDSMWKSGVQSMSSHASDWHSNSYPVSCLPFRVSARTGRPGVRIQ